MKQLLQDLKTGTTELHETPCPVAQTGRVVIRSAASLISLGTERMLVEFGKANLIEKVRRQPEKARQVLRKMKTDGLSTTLRAVSSRLSEPIKLGYSNAGTVIAVGEEVERFAVGDRVISNGPHAEFVSVPENLAARIPENVSFEDAAFTVVGSIGLQGLRLAEPTLGETVVVVGLGLIGQLTAQMAMANGCRVLGFDLDPGKVELASTMGVCAHGPSVDPVETVYNATGGLGADVVLITASSKSNAIIADAAHMSRRRGRIVLVGVVGLAIDRADFYKKELSFHVSCSYGPGRYDPMYETKGFDFPPAYVRWTEQRNFTAVLDLMSRGVLRVAPLVSETASFSDAPALYARLGQSSAIATLLTYPRDSNESRTVRISCPTTKYPAHEKPVVAVIGAGNYSRAVLTPALVKAGAHIKYICSSGGTSAQSLARRYSIPFATSESREVLDDPEVTAVVIATRHDSHLALAEQALDAGKHVFVEKPIAVSQSEFERFIESRVVDGNPLPSVLIGFNRRFSPLARRARTLIGDSRITFTLTMNAGRIPPEHWTQDPDIGGGRIIGEACHYMDLAIFLAQSPVTSVCASTLGVSSNACSDNVVIQIRCENGSIGTVNFFADGNKLYPKERIEVFFQGKVLVIDNFRMMSGFGFQNFKSRKLTSQDKGHRQQFQQYLDFLRNGGTPPICFPELLNVTRATFAAIRSVRENRWIDVAALHRRPSPW